MTVVFLHIDNKSVCQIAQGPGGLSTNIWRSIIKGGEDSVCCISHKHYILKRQKKRKPFEDLEDLKDFSW